MEACYSVDGATPASFPNAKIDIPFMCVSVSSAHVCAMQIQYSWMQADDSRRFVFHILAFIFVHFIEFFYFILNIKFKFFNGCCCPFEVHAEFLDYFELKY